MGAELGGDLHVLQRREVLNEVIKLEHKAHVAASVLRQLPPVVAGDIPAIQLHRAAGEGIHTPQNIQQRGLSGTGGPYNDADLPLLHLKGGVPQRRDLHRSGVVDLADLFKFYKSHCDLLASPECFFYYTIPIPDYQWTISELLEKIRKNWTLPPFS